MKESKLKLPLKNRKGLHRVPATHPGSNGYAAQRRRREEVPVAKNSECQRPHTTLKGRLKLDCNRRGTLFTDKWQHPGWRCGMGAEGREGWAGAVHGMVFVAKPGKQKTKHQNGGWKTKEVCGEVHKEWREPSPSQFHPSMRPLDSIQGTKSNEREGQGGIVGALEES